MEITWRVIRGEGEGGNGKKTRCGLSPKNVVESAGSYFIAHIPLHWNSPSPSKLLSWWEIILLLHQLA